MTDVTASALADALGDRYRLERELGKGGMATVYLARDLKHDRDVALKVLRPELAAMLGRDRFLAEIRLTAKLDHPHILTLIDSGESDGLLWYVIPFIRGESLRQKLQRERQLGIEEALAITKQVAGALEYAHQHGVIHRDVKPENILLHEGEAMLADFGIALAVKEAGGNRLTQTGLSLGTPQYMSPEQATGDRQLDARSDVYSLGAVLYEMLAGEPPHTGATVQAMIAKLMTERPTRLRTIRDTVPEGIDNAVARALAKSPADRFASAREFAEALGRLDSGARVVETGSGTVRQMSRRALRWSLAGVAVLSFGVLWRTWPEGGRKEDSRPALATADPRRIAVLYFEDRSAGEALDRLASSLTEALIRALSEVPDLRVISANGVAPFRGKSMAPDSIGRALAVGTIVAGQVDSVRDSIRLRVSMVDPVSQVEIAHSSLTARSNDLLSLQDTLASEVSDFLRRRLGEQIARIRGRAGTKVEGAWELVQEAERDRRDAGPLVASGDTAGATRQLSRADSLLGRAALLDPRWPDPVVQRGWVALETRHISGFDPKTAVTWIGPAHRHAEEAVTRWPEDPAARHLRGTVRYFAWVLNLPLLSDTSSDLLAGAERDLRDGTAMANPNRATAWALLSHLLLRKSRTAEGKLAAQRAYEADPYLADAEVVLYRLSSSSIDLEDPVEARRWCREENRRFPDSPYASECQLMVYTLQATPADIPRAWQLAERNAASYPPIAREFRRRRAALLVAMAIARAGLPDSARAVSRRARTNDATVDPTRELVYFDIIVYNLIGDRDEALRQLAAYLAANPQDRPTIAADQTWAFRGLREEPKFKALVQAPY